MKQSTKQKINKINNVLTGIVFTLGLVLMSCEIEDLNYWFIPFIGLVVMVAVIWINGKVGKFIEQN